MALGPEQRNLKLPFHIKLIPFHDFDNVITNFNNSKKKKKLVEYQPVKIKKLVEYQFIWNAWVFFFFFFYRIWNV